MKKDFLKHYVIGLFIVSLICVGVVLANKDNMQTSISDTKFYDEYTSYNGKETNSGKTYPEVTIAKNNLYYFNEILLSIIIL